MSSLPYDSKSLQNTFSVYNSPIDNKAFNASQFGAKMNGGRGKRSKPSRRIRRKTYKRRRVGKGRRTRRN